MIDVTLPPAQTRHTKPAGDPTDLTLGMGSQLRRIREVRCMTQGELAELVGLERTSITNIESGRQKLSLLTLKAITDALGMELGFTLKPKDAA